jgi:hypothetical protein
VKRKEVLEAATAAVMVDRAATHGAPENTFGRIARVWSAQLGVAVTPAQVCILLAELKACRAWENPGHGDNWVDGAGYYACGAEVAGGAGGGMVVPTWAEQFDGEQRRYALWLMAQPVAPDWTAQDDLSLCEAMFRSWGDFKNWSGVKGVDQFTATERFSALTRLLQDADGSLMLDDVGPLVLPVLRARAGVRE